MAGLIYGVYHQSSLNTKAKHAEIDREYKRKESLIEQAKAEWKKKTVSMEKKFESGSRTFSFTLLSLYHEGVYWCVRMLTRPAIVITDPEDSRFDLEAYLTNKAAEGAK